MKWLIDSSRVEPSNSVGRPLLKEWYGIFIFFVPTKSCFNPCKWSEYYTSKKRLNVSSNHTANIIGVKIPGSWYLFLNAMVNSLRYCFADDNDSWVFFVKPMNLEISKSCEISNFWEHSKRVLFGTISTIKILVVIDCWILNVYIFGRFFYSPSGVILLFHSNFLQFGLIESIRTYRQWD